MARGTICLTITMRRSIRVVCDVDMRLLGVYCDVGIIEYGGRRRNGSVGKGGLGPVGIKKHIVKTMYISDSELNHDPYMCHERLLWAHSTK